MSLLKKLAGETAIYGMSSILGRLLNYVILTPYLTRVFDRSEYGIFSDLYAYVALLMVFYTYRMETAFFRFGNRKEDADRTFSTATTALIFSTLFFTILFFVIAQPIANALRYPEHPEYIQWFAGVLALDTLAAIPFARLRLENRPLRFAAVRVLNILSNIVFIFFFLEFCPRMIARGHEFWTMFYNPDERLGYVFLSNLLASSVTLIPLMPLYRRWRPTIDRELLQRMLRYAAPLVVAGIAGVINQLIGTPLMKYMGKGSLSENLAMVGEFNAAAKIAILMTLFTQAFNYAAEPFFFRHSSRDDSRAIYAQVAQAFTLVGSLVFIGIMLYIDIIALFIGPAFRSGIGIVPILLIAYIFLGLFYSFSVWYKLTDQTRIGGRIALIGSLLTIGLNILLIPRWGIYGPAWAALVCYAYMAIASYWIGQRHFPIPYPVFRMGLYLLGALAGFGLSRAVEPIWNGHLILSIAGNTLILLIYFAVLGWVERQHLGRLLPARWRSS